jgi:hypothetical protein
MLKYILSFFKLINNKFTQNKEKYKILIIEVDLLFNILRNSKIRIINIVKQYCVWYIWNNYQSRSSDWKTSP